MFSVSATFGRTVTGNNQFVSVSVSDSYSWQQICGLKSVVAVPSGEDIHVTTENLYETMYRATLTVEAQPGWRLIEPTGPVQVWPGRKINYRVKQTTGREVYKSGRIILFQVDVTLRNMGEQAEEFEGGLMTGFTPCIEHCALADYPMTPVSVSCTPSDEPGDIQLTASGGNLLVKNGNDYVPAANTYTASQLRFMQFWLYPNDASSDKGDHRVKVEHLVNHCLDTALFTTLNFDFTVKSDTEEYCPVGELLDNHTATVTITCPGFVREEDFTFVFSARPKENGDLINKYGTQISFASTTSRLKWKTSPVYWYGILPDRECHTYVHAYDFDLFIREINHFVSHTYPVSIGNGALDPRMDAVYSSNSTSTISQPFLINGTGNPVYCCEITFGDFTKTSEFHDLNVTHQYQAEVVKEETYHKWQWEGTVSLENGGEGDCFTARGIRYCIENIYLPQNGEKYLFFGSTAEQARNRAKQGLRLAEQDEIFTSLMKIEEAKGFRELKAKEYAGFNAAWRYHCTYERDYGANPTNFIHPAYRNGD